MDELEFDGKVYVSSKRAAQITGYAKDYVGQLCREGRVEARLVGRNWYILENSIREHRFGKEPVKPSEKEEDGSWIAPIYASEPVASISTIDVTQRPEVKDHTATVQEMQSAWQDWFSQKTQDLPTQSEEDFPEGPEIIEPREETIPQIEAEEHEKIEEDPTEVVHVVKVAPEPITETPKESEYKAPKHFDIEAGEEIVPLRRSFIEESSDRQEISTQQFGESSHTAPATLYEPLNGPTRSLGRVLREHRVKKNKKPSVALQALLLSIAGISIVIALIGSGQVDAFLSQNKIQYAPINFLGGENIINKPNK